MTIRFVILCHITIYKSLIFKIKWFKLIIDFSVVSSILSLWCIHALRFWVGCRRLIHTCVKRRHSSLSLFRVHSIYASSVWYMNSAVRIGYGRFKEFRNYPLKSHSWAVLKWKEIIKIRGVDQKKMVSLFFLLWFSSSFFLMWRHLI